MNKYEKLAAEGRLPTAVQIALFPPPPPPVLDMEVIKRYVPKSELDNRSRRVMHFIKTNQYLPL